MTTRSAAASSAATSSTLSPPGRFDWSRAIELRDVVAGNIQVERAGASPVLFETQGVALQDVAVAGLAFERYLAKIARQPLVPLTTQPSAQFTTRKGAR